MQVRAHSLDAIGQVGTSGQSPIINIIASSAGIARTVVNEATANATTSRIRRNAASTKQGYRSGALTATGLAKRGRLLPGGS